MNGIQCCSRRFKISTIQKIKDNIIEFKYTKFFSVFAVVFALAYHVSCLITFRLLGIMPMFYFNIFSVALFSVLSILAVKKESFVGLFPFFYAEVVVHQICADFYLGGTACFHFFILLTGILPMLTFKKKSAHAIVYGVVSFLLFCVMEIFATDIPGYYKVPDITIKIIKSVNLILTIFVNIGALLLYTLILWNIEHNLMTTVEQKELENARQNQKIMVMQNNIISSLASLVENRDTDTGEHINRTSRYVELIAKEARKKGIYPEVITDDFILLAKRAAPLHDIGKIMVPDSVLKKPGRLTDEEFEMIKLHAKEGGRIISEVVGISEEKDFVKVASDVAMYHHEKWNGKGYPFGLRENDIPVSARIMAIADVFDALVSERCYKQKMTQEEALVIIRDGSGMHFDPALVDLFLAVQSEVKEIMERFKLNQ